MISITRDTYNKGHRYWVTGDNRVDPNTPLISCSTIARYANQSGDGLLYWAVNLYKDTGDRTAFVQDRELSMNIGSQLHAEIDEYLETKQPPGDASALFGAWYSSLQERGVTFQASEIMVYHSSLGYGGTLDAIGMVDGVPTLFDWKTTDEYSFPRDSNGDFKRKKDGSLQTRKKDLTLSTNYAAQLGGYSLALKNMSEEKATEMVVPQQAYIVYMFKDTNGVYWQKVNLEKAEIMFGACAYLDANMRRSRGGLYEV